MSKTHCYELKAGFAAIPNQVYAWTLNLPAERRRWVQPLIAWLYHGARGDSRDFTHDQAREHLSSIKEARTRQGTVPSRWAISRVLDEMRERALLSTDSERNKRQGFSLIKLVRWVKNRLVLRQCNTPLLHGSSPITDPCEQPGRVLHGTATPVKDGPLSEESAQARRLAARALRARFGRPPITSPA